MTEKKKIYSIIGLPASGKGTQAGVLAEAAQTNKAVGVGDLIRQIITQESDDPFVAEIKKRYDDGHPQPDNVAIDLITKFLDHADKNVLLDNFPFTREQAEFLVEYVEKHKDKFELPVLVYINVAAETAVKRAISRKVCTECKQIYGLTDEMICEECGGPLIVRADDNEETMRKRISHYVPAIKAVVDYCHEINLPVIEINGEKTVEEVSSELVSKL